MNGPKQMSSVPTVRDLFANLPKGLAWMRN